MVSSYTILIISTAHAKLLVFNNHLLSYVWVCNTTELLRVVCIDWLPAVGVPYSHKGQGDWAW